MNYSVCVFSFLLLFGFSGGAAGQSLRKKVQNAVESHCTGENRVSVMEFSKDVESSAEKVVKQAVPFLTSECEGSRYFAVRLIHYAGQLTEDAGLRREITGHLVQACRDKAGSNRNAALNYLKEYNKEDFSEVTKQALEALVKDTMLMNGKMVKLAGFLEITSLIPYLEVRVDNIASPALRWDIRLAMARMGDQGETVWIERKIKRAEVNDDFVITFIPDLIYTRQPLLIDICIDVLKSRRKNCFSPNPDAPKDIQCGYRVMEYLAPVIKDFPLTLDASGSIVTDDYRQALATARTWFRKNRGKYTIMNERY